MPFELKDIVSEYKQLRKKLLDIGLTLASWERLENNFKKSGKGAETKTASNPRKKKWKSVAFFLRIPVSQLFPKEIFLYTELALRHR